jgi:hypothetical protein
MRSANRVLRYRAEGDRMVVAVEAHAMDKEGRTGGDTRGGEGVSAGEVRGRGRAAEHGLFVIRDAEV